EVELAAALDLLCEVVCSSDVDAFACFFDQRQDVAHAEDAIGHAAWIEGFQAVEFFGHAGELDRLAGDVAHRQGGAAARVAVQLGQYDTGQRQRVAEGL